MKRNVSIVTDLEGRKIVLIHDVRFKGKKREDWESVEQYLKGKRFLIRRLALA